MPFQLRLVNAVLGCLSAACLLLATNTVAETSRANVEAATKSKPLWLPEDAYWNAYQPVVIRAACDSTGKVKTALILHTDLSPVQNESLLTLTKQTRFDVRLGTDGLIRRGLGHEEHGGGELYVFVPYAMRLATESKAPDAPTRPELEKAGLGPWLRVWDGLLPDWPLETWLRTVDAQHPLYGYTSTIRDSQMVAFGMVSFSPDGRWKLHPFYGVDFDDEGRPGLDIDQGFVLYTTRMPNQIWQHVGGTTGSYWSAEWMDNDRFVVAAVQEVCLYSENQVIFYHAPELIFGTTSGSKVITLMGPPVPITESARVWQHYDDYQRTRYPQFWARIHQK
jgi:hypothetical protein